MKCRKEDLLVNIFRFTQGILYINCQSQDMADSHNLPVKLEPLNLKSIDSEKSLGLRKPIFCTVYLFVLRFYRRNIKHCSDQMKTHCQFILFWNKVSGLSLGKPFKFKNSYSLETDRQANVAISFSFTFHTSQTVLKIVFVLRHRGLKLFA